MPDGYKCQDDDTGVYDATDGGRCIATVDKAGYVTYIYSAGLNGGYICGEYIGTWQLAPWDPMY
jgi:hypothetical protein